jgi:GDP-L-fucose synthase
MNSTYIAGHTGLVGAAVFRRLTHDKRHVLLTEKHDKLDLTRQDQTEKFFKEHKIDWVFLAAAKVGGILSNSTYKAEFIYDNLAISLNVIDAAYKTGVKKLLNLGSSCIYPKLAAQPMKEEALLSSPLESTNEAYAIAKIAALKMCRYYNEQYGTNYLSVMPTNLYGPHDNYNLETAHVLPAMLRKFHLAKLLSHKDFASLAEDLRKYPLGFGLDERLDLKNEKFIERALNTIGVSADNVLLWGTGEVYREFLHVDDLAEACVFLMEKCDYRDIGEIINIGTGEDLKLRQLALMAKEAVGFEGSIKYDASKPDGTPRKLLDISRIKSLGWTPAIPLKTGLKRSYDWYCGLAAQQSSHSAV